MVDDILQHDKEIAELEARAEWYRSWAELAGNQSDRAARFRIAAEFEREAHARAEAQ